MQKISKLLADCPVLKYYWFTSYRRISSMKINKSRDKEKHTPPLYSDTGFGSCWCSMVSRSRMPRYVTSASVLQSAQQKARAIASPNSTPKRKASTTVMCAICNFKTSRKTYNHFTSCDKLVCPKPTQNNNGFHILLRGPFNSRLDTM